MKEVEIIAQIMSELSTQTLLVAQENRLTTFASIEKYLLRSDLGAPKYIKARIELLKTIKAHIPNFLTRQQEISISLKAKADWEANIALNDKLQKNYIHNERPSLLSKNHTIIKLSSADIQESWELHLEGLNARAMNVLKQIGCKDLEKFCVIEIDKLAKQPNVGKKTLAELNDLHCKALELKAQGADHKFLSEDFSIVPKKSILKAPIALLFGLEDINAEIKLGEGEGCPFAFTETQWDILNRLNIFFENDPAEVLFSNSIEVFVKRNLPERVLLFLFSEIENSKIKSDYCCEYFASDAFFLESKYSRYSVIVLSYILGKQLSSHLCSFGYRTIRDLCANSEKSILSKYGFSLEVACLISEMWDTAHKVILYFESKDEDISIRANSINELFERLIVAIGYDERSAYVFLGRMHLIAKYGHTLEELGAYFKVTKERIRQIELKAVNAFKGIRRNSRMFTFQALFEGYVKENGLVGTSEVANFINASLCFEPLNNHKAYGYLAECIFNYEFDAGESIIIDPTYPCAQCPMIQQYIDKRFRAGYNECKVAQLESELKAECKAYPCKGVINQQTVLHALKKNSHIYIDEDIVYSIDTWAGKRGSPVQKIEEILLESKVPMHFTQIFRLLREKIPEEKEFDERSVYLWTSRNKRLLLWDRGTYVHSMNVLIDNNLMLVIEAWLEKQFDDVPVILIARVFEEFEEECRRKGIPSESALYTCLRNSGNKKFVLPKYPQIYFGYHSESHLPTTYFVEQYLLEYGGPISDQKFRDYAIAKIGMKEFQFNSFIADSLNVIKYSEREFIHIDNIKIAIFELYELEIGIVEMLKTHRHISVVQVFNLKRISCMKLGIKSPQLLYGVLKRSENSELRLGRYPIIEIAGKENDGNNKVVDKIVSFIKKKASFCTYSELEEVFVEELGYNPTTVRLVTNNPLIYKYTKGSVIHAELLGPSGDCARIEEVALVVLNLKKSLGLDIACMNDIIEEGLPDLLCSLSWTPVLLAEVLKKSKKIELIGNAKQVFGLRRSDGKDWFESVVAQLIEDKYSGAVEIHELERLLIERKLILKSFSASMLPPNSKIVVKGSTVFVKEGGLYA